MLARFRVVFLFQIGQFTEIFAKIQSFEGWVIGIVDNKTIFNSGAMGTHFFFVCIDLFL